MLWLLHLARDLSLALSLAPSLGLTIASLDPTNHWPYCLPLVINFCSTFALASLMADKASHKVNMHCKVTPD